LQKRDQIRHNIASGCKCYEQTDVRIAETQPCVSGVTQRFFAPRADIQPRFNDPVAKVTRVTYTDALIIMRFPMLLALLLQAAASTLTPQPPVAPLPPSQTTTVADDSRDEAVGDPNRTICRSIAVTGSRLGRQRVCQTAAQWQQVRRDNRRNIERAQADRPTAGN
jgi:hypothetical protein